jgi:hypothetical protein
MSCKINKRTRGIERNFSDIFAIEDKNIFNLPMTPYPPIFVQLLTLIFRSTPAACIGIERDRNIQQTPQSGA